MKYLLLLVFSFVIISCGYQSYEECFARETQKFQTERITMAERKIAYEYCSSLDFDD